MYLGAMDANALAVDTGTASAALVASAKAGDEAAVTRLLTARVDANAADPAGRTAVMQAAARGREAVHEAARGREAASSPPRPT